MHIPIPPGDDKTDEQTLSASLNRKKTNKKNMTTSYKSRNYADAMKTTCLGKKSKQTI